MEESKRYLRLFVMGNVDLDERFGVDICPHIVILDPSGEVRRSLGKRTLVDLRAPELRQVLRDLAGAPPESSPAALPEETRGTLRVGREGVFLDGEGGEERLSERAVFSVRDRTHRHQGRIVVLAGGRLEVERGELLVGPDPEEGGAAEITLVDQATEDAPEDEPPGVEGPVLAVREGRIAAIPGGEDWVTVSASGRARARWDDSELEGGVYAYGPTQVDLVGSRAHDVGAGGEAALRVEGSRVGSISFLVEGLEASLSGLRAGEDATFRLAGGPIGLDVVHSSVQRFVCWCDLETRLELGGPGAETEAPPVTIAVGASGAVAGTPRAPLALPTGFTGEAEVSLAGFRVRLRDVRLLPWQVTASDRSELHLAGAFEATSSEGGSRLHLHGSPNASSPVSVRDGSSLFLTGAGTQVGERGGWIAQASGASRLELEDAVVRVPIQISKGSTVLLRDTWFVAEEEELVALLAIEVSGESTLQLDPPRVDAPPPPDGIASRFPPAVAIEPGSRVLVQEGGRWIPLEAENPWGVVVTSFGEESIEEAAPPGPPEPEPPPRESLDAVPDFDELLERGVRAAGISPAPPCDDETFLRRVHLDTGGAIPSPEEVVAFRADSDPEKRARKVDELLASEAFAEHQSRVWQATLIGTGTGDSGFNPWFQEWLRESFAENRPYDRMVREILVPEGWVDEAKSSVYLHRWTGVDDRTSAVTRHFLGVQIRCAQCHDHPFDQWKQRDYWGMAAFLARTDIEYSETEKVIEPTFQSETERTRVIEYDEGEVDLPSSKHPLVVAPRFLGTERDLDPERRRAALADWIVSPENPWFARALVNRLWGQLTGRGFVHPVDDLKPSNAPSHPEAFDALARRFVAGGFDLRDLFRAILLSRAYQRSSSWPGGAGRPGRETFAVANVRALSRYQLVESIGRATDFDF